MREGEFYRVYMLAEYPIEGNTLRAIAQTEDLINKFKGDKERAFKELDREIDSNRGNTTLNDTPVVPDVDKQSNYQPTSRDGDIIENVIYDDGEVYTSPL